MIFSLSGDRRGDVFEWKPSYLMLSHLKAVALEGLQPNLAVDLNEVLRAPSLIRLALSFTDLSELG